MTKKYQIFVSSTYEDLKDERDQVIKAILEMNHIPVGMEMFSAADEQQWAIIERTITESDYYVVLVAHRYGSLVDGVSYTEKEYDLAQKLEIPIHGFVISDEAHWPMSRKDSDFNATQALEAFKDKVRDKPVGSWASKEELYGQCVVALMKAFSANPREGWVRASESANPKVMDELSRLSAENADLRARLAQSKIDSQTEHQQAITDVIKRMSKVDIDMSYRNTEYDKWKDGLSLSLLKIFRLMGPMMNIECSVDTASQYLAMYAKNTPEEIGHRIPTNYVDGIFSKLQMLELAEPSKRKHQVSDINHYWCLTKFGVETLKRIELERLDAKKESELEAVTQEVKDGESGAVPGESQEDES